MIGSENYDCCIETGEDNFIAKPVKGETLLKKLDSIFKEIF